MPLQMENCEAEKKTFLNSQQQKTTRLEKRLNCFFILSTENDITTSLSYKEAIKGHADKECRKEVLEECVRKLFNEHTVLLFWILLYLWYLSAILNL
jgi:hypothetical protein